MSFGLNEINLMLHILYGELCKFDKLSEIDKKYRAILIIISKLEKEKEVFDNMIKSG